MPGGAPIGNQNAKNKGQFKEALKKALAQEHGSVSKGLVKVAASVVKSATEGEQWAVQELANRFDGKPAQVIQGDEDNPLSVKITEVILRPLSEGDN